eukprot:6176844-Pleurochrysis_carterae.AAC.2
MAFGAGAAHPFNPPNGSRMSFLGGMRRWRDIWISPTTQSDSSDQHMFNVVPVATMMETMFYMGLRAICWSSIRSSRFCNSA